MNIYFWLEFREWVDVITIPYGAASQPQHSLWERRWVPNGNLDNLPSRFPFSDHAQFWWFHVVILQRTAKKCTQFENARIELLFCSLDLLFCHVLVAVVVTVVVCYRSVLTLHQDNIILINGNFTRHDSFFCDRFQTSAWSPLVFSLFL